LNKEIKKNEKPPIGWLNMAQIPKLVGKSRSWCEKYVDENLIKENSDKKLIKQYLDKNNNLIYYYSPELVILIKEGAKKFAKPPKGWFNMYELRKKMKKSRFWFEKRIITILEKNKDQNWQENYSDKGGNLVMYYSPEMIDLFKKEVNEYTEAPDGWLTCASIKDLLDRSQGWCEKKIRIILSENPDKDWENKYLSKHNGILRVHYSQELIDILKQEADKYESAPEGWFNISEIAKLVGMGEDWTSKNLKKIIEKNPDKDWKKKYLDGINNVNYHYSSEVVEKLKELIVL
jgi:hypothetical protein